MKKIISICSFFLCILLMASCQNEEELSNSNVGYLRLNLGVNTAANTRADEAPYNPEQIAIRIISAEGEVVKETSDWTDWAGTQIALPVGTYTLQASSAGFDGATSGFDKPYYAGSAQISIEKNKEVNQTITCTLANVKVTVNFDQSFVNAFKSANVEVDDNANNAGIDPLTFTMGQTTQSGYFPVTDLKAVVSVVNKSDIPHSQEDIIEGVKARDHYILNYKVADTGTDTGAGDVSITVDPTTKEYTYTFYITTTPTEPQESPLSAPTANAWAKLAYLTGTVSEAGSNLTSANIAFQYREKDAAEWTTVAATQEAGSYKATVTSLQPNTAYESRMVYGEEEYVSEVTEFTTEDATALYNGNFDDWYQADKVWYAVAEGDYNGGYAFWDSGNEGTSMMSKNPTSPEEGVVHTSGGKSAKLESQFVGIFGVGKFAAGNIYTGNYCETFMSPMGARIRFGKEFASRPTKLQGWYKYTRGTNIDEDNDATYTNILNEAGGDLCSVYIALTDNEGLQADNVAPAAAFEIDNRLSADEPEKFKYKNAIDFSTNNPHIIAYGTITDEEAKGAADWTQFTIDLKYRDLTRKPKYIIIVASASKYGDYFTGSTSSVMYIDDFSLVYDGEPAVE